MGIIGGPADQIFRDVEFQVTIIAHPVDNAAHLRHDFGADAVTGKDQQGRGRHGAILRGGLQG